MTKFRIYVDEVGNPDLESSNNPNHRFLSLTGVICELDYVAKVLQPEMEDCKRRFFGAHPDDPVIFHRKEMLNAKPPFQALKDPHLRQQFDTELLGLLRQWHYTAISVCIDKKRHKETYSTWRYDPYHYCLAVLLERFTIFCRRRNARGDMLAESRGGKEDRRLKDSFARLWQNGSDYMNANEFQETLTSKQLKVKTKANNIAGLQIADLIAHPSRSEILTEQNLFGRPIAPFAQQIIQILQGKYDKLRNGRSVGKKFL